MRLLVFIIFLLLIGCGRGPARDRAEENCQLNKNYLFLILNNNDFGETSKRVTLMETYFKCTEEENDTLLNRYYRGYVLNKE